MEKEIEDLIAMIKDMAEDCRALERRVDDLHSALSLAAEKLNYYCEELNSQHNLNDSLATELYSLLKKERKEW